MSIFSTNQARQFYVASGLLSSGRVGDTNNSTVGTIDVKENATHMWFEYMGAGGPTRSDLIPLNHVRAITQTNAEDMERKLNAVQITINPALVDNGAVAGGNDCILNITIPNYENGGAEYKLLKHGAVHTYNTMSTSDFYKTLACSIYGSVSHDAVKPFKVLLKTASTSVEVTSTKKDDYSSTSAIGVYLVEAEQPWSRGKIAQYEIEMRLNGNTVINNAEEVNWLVTDYTVNSGGTFGTLKNGKATCDLEWFCMGERGDIYRGAGWPMDIPTEYQTVPTAEYDYIDIHYFFQGEGISVQQSEKTITIVATKSSTVVDSIVEAIVGLDVLPTYNGMVPEGNIDFSGD